MKFGDSGATISFDGEGRQEPVFRYWVLPDKPQVVWINYTLGWDQAATDRQSEQIKGYLIATLSPGSWIIRNHRIYFEKKEDFEMFKTMCQIGWA